MTNNDFQQLLDQVDSVPASDITARIESLLASHHDTLDHGQQVDLLYLEYLTRTSAGDANVVDDLRRRHPSLETDIVRQIKVDTELSRWDDTSIAPPPNDSTESSHRPAGHCIGDYTVLEKIGEGAQAEVFRVVHPQLRCELALKVSRHQSEKAGRILDEGRLLVTVNDPGIARVIDAGIWDDRPFIVSELVRGTTLQKRVEQNSLTTQQLVEFVAEISRTLGKLHDQGIVHCDIKPTNVLFDSQGQPKLIDFGMAVDHSTDGWDADSILRDAHAGGTLAYMAPELLVDSGESNGQSEDASRSRGPANDVFSLGGLLYFGLVGRHPYASKTSGEIIDAVASGDWDRQALRDSGAPLALQKACEQAMQLRPSERIESAQRFADSLDGWLARTRRKDGRRIALFVIPLIALLCVGWLAWPGQQSETHTAQPLLNLPSIETVERFGNLDIKVWAEERAFELVNRVPVLSGEQIQVNAPLRANHHGELWLISSDGETNRFAEFEPLGESRWVHFPSDAEKAVPLVGPAGSEAVVWIESASPLSERDVQAMLGQPKNWPALGDATVFRLVDGQLRVEQDDRAFGQSTELESPDAVVQKHLRAVTKELQSQGKHVEIVAFSHIEE
ncbi:serine/threonine protein kinase [Gimesia maris]|uniref:serine/threonine protein kinase n=1 Tax=Planctomycetia TaxID=203683 RepID=UPI003A910A94